MWVLSFNVFYQFIEVYDFSEIFEKLRIAYFPIVVPCVDQGESVEKHYNRACLDIWTCVRTIAVTF